MKTRFPCLTLLVLACHTALAEPGKNAEQTVLDDKLLVSQFETKMAELLEKGNATPQNDLNSQLDRTSCHIELPVAGKTRMTPAEIYERRLSSAVMVGKLYHCSSKSCKKVHSNIASGVIVHEDGMVLTNHHVVLGKQSKGLGMGVMTADGKAFLVDEVLAADKAADIALLRLKDAKGLPAAPITAEEPVGAEVTLISHPSGNFFCLSHGRISRYCKDSDGSCTMQITADYAKGSSGGPIFNDRGDVVGIVSSTVSIPYRQMPLALEGEDKVLQAAGKGKPPTEFNNMPLVMDMNHQMTFKNAVASREVLKLIK